MTKLRKFGFGLDITPFTPSRSSIVSLATSRVQVRCLSLLKSSCEKIAHVIRL